MQLGFMLGSWRATESSRAGDSPSQDGVSHLSACGKHAQRGGQCKGPGVGNAWPEHRELGLVKGQHTRLQEVAGWQIPQGDEDCQE